MVRKSRAQGVVVNARGMTVALHGVGGTSPFTTSFLFFYSREFECDNHTVENPYQLHRQPSRSFMQSTELHNILHVFRPHSS